MFGQLVLVAVSVAWDPSPLDESLKISIVNCGTGNERNSDPFWLMIFNEVCAKKAEKSRGVVFV